MDELQTAENIDSDEVAEIAELERQILITRQAAIDIFPKLLPSAASEKKPQEKVPPVVVPGTLRGRP